MAAAGDHAFGGVGEKCRAQIDQGEAHSPDMSAIVFAGQTVSDLMDAHEHGRQQPKSGNISPGLIGKVVELEGVVSYFAPVGHEDTAHKQKGGQGD